MNKVSIISDGDGHIFVVPITMRQEIERDLENEDFCDSGEFSTKWSWYQIDSLDDIDLFANVE